LAGKRDFLPLHVTPPRKRGRDRVKWQRGGGTARWFKGKGPPTRERSREKKGGIIKRERENNLCC